METTLNEITMFCKCCVAMGCIIISVPLLSSLSSYEMSRIKEKHAICEEDVVRVLPINAVALRCGRRRTGSMVAARLVTLLPFSVSPSTWYHVLSHCYHRGFLVCYHVSSWLNERVARRSCDRGEHLEGFANKILWNILNSKMTSVSNNPSVKTWQSSLPPNLKLNFDN